ncbi:MAG: hypothetical protein ACKOTZ_00385 [Chloroflexota bacterium]
MNHRAAPRGRRTDSRPTRDGGRVAARRREESRRPAYVLARAEDAASSEAVASLGFLGMIRRCVAEGSPLPDPFSDPGRIASIAGDGSAPAEWRAAARYLLAEDRPLS